MENAILIIDMQNDFVLPGAPLCVAGARETVPSIKKFLEYGREKKWKIIHVVREHDSAGTNADKPRRHLFENGGKGYCVSGSEGAKIVEGLEPLENETVLKKTRNSAFFGTNLDSLLRRMKVERVFIAGTQYPNCIRGTAADAMCLDYDVTVVTDCCSAKTSEIAAANILDMENMGIRCVMLEKVIEEN